MLRFIEQQMIALQRVAQAGFDPEAWLVWIVIGAVILLALGGCCTRD